MKKLSSLFLLLLVSCAGFSTLHQKRSTVTVTVKCESGEWRGSGVLVSNHHVITAKHLFMCKNDIYTVYIKNYENEIFVGSVDQVSAFDAARIFIVSDQKYNVYANETPLEIGDIVCGVFPRREYLFDCGRVLSYSGGRFVADIYGEFGDSGSPLFDTDGRVVGIAVSKSDKYIYVEPAYLWNELIVYPEPDLQGVWP